MRPIALVASLVLAAACQDQPVSPTPIDRQIVLAPGESTVVAPQVSVRFVTVAGDSRCPGDATCITAGDATVRIDISSGAEQAQRDLHTATRQPVSYQDLRIELVSLDPYPFHFRPIQPGDYRATLRILR
jgi:hypothetical protein